MCLASIHNTEQNSSDNLPSYLQTNTIAQMLSVGEEGSFKARQHQLFVEATTRKKLNTSNKLPASFRWVKIVASTSHRCERALNASWVGGVLSAGVSGLDMCLSNCTWSGDRLVDLYPWDAGTDSGITYMVCRRFTLLYKLL